MSMLLWMNVCDVVVEFETLGVDFGIIELRSPLNGIMGGIGLQCI